jgi:hypothetical protein
MEVAMSSSSDDLMTQLIRSKARSVPPDLNDHQAVNAAIREAAGVRTPGLPPPLPPPPLPGDDRADYNRWADAAAAAGVPARELAAYTGRWVAQHRQVLADREADQ